MLRVVAFAALAVSCGAPLPRGESIAPTTVSMVEHAIYRVVLDSVLPAERALLLRPIRYVGHRGDTANDGFVVLRSAAAEPANRIAWGQAFGLEGDAPLDGGLLARVREVEFLRDGTGAAVAFVVVACSGRCAPESLAWLARDERLEWHIDSITVLRRVR